MYSVVQFSFVGVLAAFPISMKVVVETERALFDEKVSVPGVVEADQYMMVAPAPVPV